MVCEGATGQINPLLMAWAIESINGRRWSWSLAMEWSKREAPRI